MRHREDRIGLKVKEINMAYVLSDEVKEVVYKKVRTLTGIRCPYFNCHYMNDADEEEE